MLHFREVRHVLVSFGVLAGLLLAGCDQKPSPSGGAAPSGTAAKPPSAATSKAAASKDDDDDHDHDHDHGHTHKAPRGGALVEIGEHFAHFEFLLDKTTGKLDVYLLDGHAENAVRSKQATIELTIRVTAAEPGKHAEDKPFTLTLAGVASALTGETATDTSHFSGQSDLLMSVTNFSATVKSIDVRGKTHNDVEFRYPEGNE